MERSAKRTADARARGRETETGKLERAGTNPYLLSSWGRRRFKGVTWQQALPRRIITKRIQALEVPGARTEGAVAKWSGTAVPEDRLAVVRWL